MLIKFVCDSSQGFAKDIVEDACDLGQRFVKGALHVPRSRVSPELLTRAPLSRFATVYRVSRDSHLTRFFSPCYTSFVAPHTKGAIISVLLFYA